MWAALPEEMQLAALVLVGGERLCETVRLASLSRSARKLARESVRCLIYDSNPAVRLQATSAAIEVAEVGQPGFVRLVLERAADDDAQVRVTAASALGYLVEEGEEDFSRAVVVVGNLLRDDAREVRQSAYAALKMLLDRGSLEGVAAVSNVASDAGCSIEVRTDALQHLGEVAFRDDHVAMAATVDCLDDRCDDVRHEAIATFGQIARIGDPYAVARLCDFMQEPDCVERRAAVVASGMVAARGDQRMVTALLERLQDSACSVRLMALAALAEVALPGDTAAHTAAAHCRGDADEAVRNEAEKVTAHLTKCLGNESKSSTE